MTSGDNGYRVFSGPGQTLGSAYNNNNTTQIVNNINNSTNDSALELIEEVNQNHSGQIIDTTIDLKNAKL